MVSSVKITVYKNLIISFNIFNVRKTADTFLESGIPALLNKSQYFDILKTNVIMGIQPFFKVTNLWKKCVIAQINVRI
jgi:hypothetical protein